VTIDIASHFIFLHIPGEHIQNHWQWIQHCALGN